MPFIRTQGVKGTNITNFKEVGYLECNTDSGLITIDDFEGSGESYKRREKTLVKIRDENGVVYSGEMNQLIRIIKRYKHGF